MDYCMDEPDNVRYIQKVFDETIQERNCAVEQHEHLLRRHERLKHELKIFSEKYKCQNIELMRQKEENCKLVNDNMELRSTICQLKEELRDESRDNELAQYECKFEKLKAENEAQCRMSEALRRENAKLKAALEAAEHEQTCTNSLAQEKLKDLLEKLNVLQEANKALRAKKERLKQLLCEVSKQYEEANQDLQRARNQMTMQGIEVERYKKKVRSMMSKIKAKESEQMKKQHSKTEKCETSNRQERCGISKHQTCSQRCESSTKCEPNMIIARQSILRNKVCDKSRSRHEGKDHMASKNSKCGKCRNPREILLKYQSQLGHGQCSKPRHRSAPGQYQSCTRNKSSDPANRKVNFRYSSSDTQCLRWPKQNSRVCTAIIQPQVMLLRQKSSSKPSDGGKRCSHERARIKKKKKALGDQCCAQ